MANVQVEWVELVQGDGHRRVECWRLGHPAAHDARHVMLGTLADGRWWVRASGDGRHAQVLGDEGAARAYLAGLTGDGWYEWPANFGPDGKPRPAGAWEHRGGRWVRTTTPA